MSHHTTVSLDALRPSQCYVDAGKLAAVLDRVDAAGFGLDPLPVYEFQEYPEPTLTDGHTRAFVANLMGRETVPVAYDDRLPEEYDLALYRECIGWCVAAGVERVPDLVGRVVAPAVFQRQWVDRCERAAERVAE